jgi:hypothetical protein
VIQNRGILNLVKSVGLHRLQKLARPILGQPGQRVLQIDVELLADQTQLVLLARFDHLSAAPERTRLHQPCCGFLRDSALDDDHVVVVADGIRALVGQLNADERVAKAANR